jgi:hypothetical protein
MDQGRLGSFVTALAKPFTNTLACLFIFLIAGRTLRDPLKRMKLSKT